MQKEATYTYTDLENKTQLYVQVLKLYDKLSELNQEAANQYALQIQSN